MFLVTSINHLDFLTLYLKASKVEEVLRRVGKSVRELGLDLLKLVRAANFSFSRQLYKRGPELVKQVRLLYNKSLEGFSCLLLLRRVCYYRNKVIDHFLSGIKGVFAAILVTGFQIGYSHAYSAIKNVVYAGLLRRVVVLINS